MTVPSSRFEKFACTFAANTAIANATTVSCAFKPGWVNNIWITFPLNTSNDVGVRLMHAGGQLVPWTVGQWLIADNYTFLLDVEQWPNAGAWSLLGYNTDVYDHSIHVFFAVTEVGYGTAFPDYGAISSDVIVPPTVTTGEAPPEIVPPTVEPPVTEPPVQEPPPPTNGGPPPPTIDQPPPPTPTPVDETPVTVTDIPPDSSIPGSDAPVAPEPPPAPTASTPTPSAPAPASFDVGREIPGIPGSFVGNFFPRGTTITDDGTARGARVYVPPLTPVVAPGNGYVRLVVSDPQGFGPNYPVVHFTDGRYKGRDIAIGFVGAHSPKGHKFTPGEWLGQTANRGVGAEVRPGEVELIHWTGNIPKTPHKLTPQQQQKKELIVSSQTGGGSVGATVARTLPQIPQPPKPPTELSYAQRVRQAQTHASLAAARAEQQKAQDEYKAKLAAYNEQVARDKLAEEHANAAAALSAGQVLTSGVFSFSQQVGAGLYANIEPGNVREGMTFKVTTYKGHIVHEYTHRIKGGVGPNGNMIVVG